MSSIRKIFRRERYVVVQRAGVMGEGRELQRFPYFSKNAALRFANMANAQTERTWCAVERCQP